MVFLEKSFSAQYNEKKRKKGDIMKHKIISSILIFVIIFSLCLTFAGCNSSSGDIAPTNNSESVTDTTINNDDSEENLPTENNTQTKPEQEIDPEGENTTQPTTNQDDTTNQTENTTETPSENKKQDENTEQNNNTSIENRPVVKDPDTAVGNNTTSGGSNQGSGTTSTTVVGGGNGTSGNTGNGASGNTGNGTSGNTGNTNTGNNGNVTIEKDDTAFATYKEFYNKQLATNNHTFTAMPNSASTLSTKCDCNIKFSGAMENGTITVKINGKNHSHTWSSWDNSTLGATLINSCTTCGFTKGSNFIYIKLPNANHGHGWSWSLKETLVKPTSCACEYNIAGNYLQGSVSVMLNGYVHGHVWGGNNTTGMEEPNRYASSDTFGDSLGSAEMTPVQTYPARACTECGFQRTILSTTKGIMGYVRINCGKDKTKAHIYEFPMHNTAEGDYTYSNCACGFASAGDEYSGGYNFIYNGEKHSHGWMSQTMITYPHTTSPSSPTGVALGNINCKICNFVRTKSGYSVVCPITGMRHSVQFGYLIEIETFANNKY